MLKKYLENLQATLNKGDAREESFYGHLEDLFEEFAAANGIKNVDITVLPKQTEAGNPDFRVWDGRYHITGYIEAKHPSETNLDWIEDSEQMNRYLTTFPNVILTNFYEFRLYRDGQLIDKVAVARPVIALKLQTAPPVENEAAFYALLEKFFAFSLPAIKTAKGLALELAKRTRFLRDEVITIELAEEEKKGKKAILGFFEAFKKYLLGTLTEAQFADLYAQTLTYGLFAARTRADDEFNREMAFKYIPHTIGILRDVFRFISLEEPPKSLQIIVDDIAEVLKVTGAKKILHDYFRKGRGKDPIIHFYETFLAAYDPEIRERRGVYYTPEPVVGYIVRSLHAILKSHFDLADGLASPDVTLLDPAGGTLTFPAEAIKTAVEEYTQKYGEGGKHNLIKNQILRNFYAFELMMAPYAIGHLKMSFLLEELGYRLGDDERFRLYLTNTLEMEELEQIEIPGLSSLSEESHLAGKVKKQRPILVILGNPPYSGISANVNEWTERLLKQDLDGAQSYYKIDGKPLAEKNPKWLQDDYVKFLRFAQWKIETVGHGVVGMITNHSYLDNPTFRGMRQSLMQTFNEIYVLDLHGNSLKRETTPDGGKDENVFDIRQGVAIALFVKLKNATGCKVFHQDVFGLREEKYHWLETNDLKVKNYRKITPVSPYYFFIRRETARIQQYLEWKRINEIFPVNSVGVVTSRDEFVIGFTKEELKNRILQFRNPSLSDEIVAKTFGLKDKRNWKIKGARKEIQDLEDWHQYFQEILYRPFDNRVIYYHPAIIERMRLEVMRNMFRANLGLAIGRQGHVVGLESSWNLAFISEHIVDFNLFYRGGELLLPLYIYPGLDKENNPKHGSTMMMVFEPQAEYSVRRPNIAPIIFEKLNQAYKQKPTPEEILYYIYGVLYSNPYREKYAEFLQIDFPRVPFTANYKTFKAVAALGQKLAELHLLKSPQLDRPIAKYQGKGENDRIEKLQYKEAEQRVYINKDKYFEGIPAEVWGYQIGGYQVLHKYLKDRKGRRMDDPRHYCRIATAIAKTIELQKEIDKIYDEVEKSLLGD